MLAVAPTKVRDMDFPEKLKKLLEGKGWTQNRLSQELQTRLGHVSKSKVSDWVSGRYVPNLHEVGELARIFGVDTDFLVYGDLEEPRVLSLTDEERVLLRVLAQLKIPADQVIVRLFESKGSHTDTGPPRGGVAPRVHREKGKLKGKKGDEGGEEG